MAIVWDSLAFCSRFPVCSMLPTAQPPPTLPDLRDCSWPGQFLSGIRLAFSSIRWSYTHPGLRVWAWLALGLNLCVYLGVLFAGWNGMRDLAMALGPTPDPQAAQWLVTLAGLVQGVIQFLVLTAWVLASVYLSLAICNVLSSPLFDLLSERTERHVVGAPPTPTALSLWTMVVDAARELRVQVVLLLIYIPVTLCILVLGVIPVVGTVLAPLLAWMWTSLWVSLTFTAQASARHRLGVRTRVGFLLRHLPLCLGFGGVQSLIPFLFVPWMAPALVVGGTRMYLQLAIWNRAPSLLSETQKQALRLES